MDIRTAKTIHGDRFKGCTAWRFFSLLSFVSILFIPLRELAGLGFSRKFPLSGDIWRKPVLWGGCLGGSVVWCLAWARLFLSFTLLGDEKLRRREGMEGRGKCRETLSQTDVGKASRLKFARALCILYAMYP